MPEENSGLSPYWFYFGQLTKVYFPDVLREVRSPLWHSHQGQVSKARETYLLDGQQYLLVAAATRHVRRFVRALLGTSRSEGHEVITWMVLLSSREKGGEKAKKSRESAEK